MAVVRSPAACLRVAHIEALTRVAQLSGSDFLFERFGVSIAR